MSANPFAKSVDEACRTAFSTIGFRRRVEGIYTRMLNDDVMASVGLNRVMHRDHIEINTMIAVRHEPLERRLAAIDGRRIKTYNPVTINCHLGYFMPEDRYTPWWFSPGEDHREPASGLTAAVVEYGFPFFRANLTLDELIRSLREDRYADKQSRQYRLPVAFLLLGRHDAAKDAIGEALKEIGTRTDAAAENYRSFAQRFLGPLSEPNSF
jgi:hypothetical protein